MCGKKAMANSVMCTKCGKWVLSGCAKIKKVTSTMEKGFVCELCVNTTKGIVKPSEEILLFDQVEFVKSFLLFGGQVECQ